MARFVEIADYDPAWPERFEAEAARIRRALRGVAVRIEHVGSTAVPGLAAKPTIDIQISVHSFAPEEAFRAPLERLGYVFYPDDVPDHRFFRPPDGRPRSSHVHVCEAGSAWERGHLAFRDYLRGHPDVAAEYEALKRRIAELFPHDSQGYAEAKDPFIRPIELVALAWAGHEPVDRRGAG